MTKKTNLKEKIDFGSDIEFKYDGKHYTILAWVEDGIVIGEQNSDKQDVFKDYDDLVDNFRINQKPFKEILNDIEITFSTI